MHRLLSVAFVTGALLAGSAAAAPAPGLWRVYDGSLARAKCIDLTHTIAPGIPVWKGVWGFDLRPYAQSGERQALQLCGRRLRGDAL